MPFSQAEELLRSTFGYHAFRPHQEEIIARVMAGEDTLVVMPTGGGKSMCFQIPAILRPGVGLVVSPLISLMQDQVAALVQAGVRAAYLNSSQSREEQRSVEGRLFRKELDLLYVAPERLFSNGFTERLKSAPPALLAVDEAHCISQWGHDFRPEYSRLAELRSNFPGVPCIAVTATADAPTRQDISTQLSIPPDGVIVTGFDRPNIRYRVVAKNRVKGQLLEFIETEHPDDAGIVYCMSRKSVEETAAFLQGEGHVALPYHAGLSPEERQRNQARFISEEGVIVVATVAFGMGIDKPNVRFVAHTDVPRSPEAYYQETGRAGRDGLPADAWLAYRVSDVLAIRRLTEQSGVDDPQRWIERHKLNAMAGYCETAVCRRRVLLNYFGDTAEERCGNCDTCLSPVETWDATVPVQKALSCIARTGQRFGTGHLIDVLLGKETEKVAAFRHGGLSTFGIGKEHSEAEWRSIFRQIVAADLVQIDVQGYSALRLSEACGDVLAGRRRVELRKDPPPTRKRGRKDRARASELVSAPNKALFDALRATRLAIAQEQNVPPYVIFHDSTLLEMAERRPRDAASLREISGVGATKLERYGHQFLDSIRSAELNR